MEEDLWHWQESGTAWKGVGVYHITLTVPSRQPLLGKLIVPDDDPSHAWVERTALGNAVIDELYVMCKHYPAIRIFQFCLMPEHLHAVIQVTKVMDTSIRSVIRGYWQGVKKLGRAYTLSVSPVLNSRTTNQEKLTNQQPTTTEEKMAEGGVLILSPWKYDAGKRHISRSECVALNQMAEEIARQSTSS